MKNKIIDRNVKVKIKDLPVRTARTSEKELNKIFGGHGYNSSLRHKIR